MENKCKNKIIGFWRFSLATVVGCTGRQAGCKQNERVGDASCLAHDHVWQQQEERHLVGRFRELEGFLRNNTFFFPSVQCYEVGRASRAVSTSLLLLVWKSRLFWFQHPHSLKASFSELATVNNKGRHRYSIRTSCVFGLAFG